ncbi:hypothetical protein ABSL23_17210 (plasmid) [Halobacterium sp. NMX12-1]|jgi:hypothetical protein|uniref:Uncharacterized protein n=1 Tax=Halobacterium sp. NMX12-1 TaxID=3166650 RepID=A0AAU8CH89_9EURY
MNEIMAAVVAVKALILGLGGAITYIAHRAYRRTGDPSLGLLRVGFGIVTFGALFTGIANVVYSVSLAVGVLVNSTFVAAGLAVILYSLYVQD